MTQTQSKAQRATWQARTPDQRRSVTGPAIAAAGRRRRLAHRLLNAIEASGMRVEFDDDSEPA